MSNTYNVQCQQKPDLETPAVVINIPEFTHTALPEMRIRLAFLNVYPYLKTALLMFVNILVWVGITRHQYKWITNSVIF